MDEFGLWLQMKNGRLEALETLMDRYTSYVATIIYQVAGTQINAHDIEELTADVFIKIWNAREKIVLENGNPKAYMAKISRNVTINHLKKGKIFAVELEESVENFTPETDFLEQEMQTEIAKIVKTLPSQEQEIFIRRYFYFEKIKDISLKMKLNENTIHTKLRRSKKKLEKIFVERGIV